MSRETAEVEVMLPRAGEHVEPQEAGIGKEGSCPQSLWRAGPCQHFDFRFLASRTVREKDSAVLRHPVNGA